MQIQVAVAVAVASLSSFAVADGPRFVGTPTQANSSVQVANALRELGGNRFIVPDAIGVVNTPGTQVYGLPVGKVELLGRLSRTGGARLIPIEPQGKVELIPLDIRMKLLLIGH